MRQSIVKMLMILLTAHVGHVGVELLLWAPGNAALGVALMGLSLALTFQHTTTDSRNAGRAAALTLLAFSALFYDPDPLMSDGWSPMALMLALALAVLVFMPDRKPSPAKPLLAPGTAVVASTFLALFTLSLLGTELAEQGDYQTFEEFRLFIRALCLCLAPTALFRAPPLLARVAVWGWAAWFMGTYVYYEGPYDEIAWAAAAAVHAACLIQPLFGRIKRSGGVDYPEKPV